MEPIAVLVVDDEESVRGCLSELLSGIGYQARTAANGEQALEMLAQGCFDAVLLDVLLPKMSGLEVLERYRSSGGQAPVIVLSGLSTADDAMRAMKLGATDYLAKPFENRELEDSLSRALGRETSVEQQPSAPPSPRRPAPEEPEDREPQKLIFASSAMRRARELVERIADADVPVLLLGESGTGKEVIAHEIHSRSRRRAHPFIKVNCAALPAELLESELFGHERGAFTGATAEKPGKFELADQGTIFLDEIGEMAIRLQAKLLQVLQDEEFYRVGGKKSVKVDARVVVATNRELEREIEAGNFREDLFYRLNVVAIRVAPLRERREDILPLAEHFMRKYGRRYQDGAFELGGDLLDAFLAHDWPGNVRELENMVRRLVVLKDPGLVLEELKAATRAPHSAPSLPTAYAGGEERAPALPPVPERARREPNAAYETPFGSQPTLIPEENPASAPGLNRLVPPRYGSLYSIPQPPPPPPSIPEGEMSLKDIGKRAAMLAEREAILAMLQRTGWNKRKAAGKLRISYKALLYKIKGSGIIDPRSSAEI